MVLVTDVHSWYRRGPARGKTGGGSAATFRKIGDGATNVVVREPGRFFALCLDTFRAVFQWPFQWREFIQQAWFIVSVTVVPTMLVAIPFGGVLSLQVGGLIRQLGAQSYTGATAVVAIVREASPLVTSLLVAGAAGSAMCADIGSRKIREEIDAMEVLGINPCTAWWCRGCSRARSSRCS